MEIQALVTADVEGCVDNARMRQITSEHAADVTKLLQNLVSRGILIQDGQGRWTRYRLANELGTIHKEGHTIHKEGHTIHNEGHTIHKEVYSVKEIETSDYELDGLLEIAGPAKQNRRLSYKEMEVILLKLCEGRWLSRKRIADLLERNDVALRSRFLAPMVERGLLSLRYPEAPHNIQIRPIRIV